MSIIYSLFSSFLHFLPSIFFFYYAHPIPLLIIYHCFSFLAPFFNEKR